MRRLFKPLRVLLALGCFALVNAAFLVPMLAASMCLDDAATPVNAACWQLWPAMVALNLPVVAAILAVTALMGRVYCSTVCPLGVWQDFAFRVRRLFTKRGLRYSPPLNRVRYAIFALCVLAAFAGCFALPALVEPYSVYGRFVTQLVRPALQWAVNLLAAWCEAHEKYWVMSDEVVVAGFLSFWVAAVSIVAITALAACAGRWFCNAVCPVGTLLSLVSKRPLMSISIDAARCVRCGACMHVCKAACIDVKNMAIDNSRCVRCFNCLGVCRKGAVKL